jgi:hypothetical protein
MAPCQDSTVGHLLRELAPQVLGAVCTFCDPLAGPNSAPCRLSHLPPQTLADHLKKAHIDRLAQPRQVQREHSLPSARQLLYNCAAWHRRQVESEAT